MLVEIYEDYVSETLYINTNRIIKLYRQVLKRFILNQLIHFISTLSRKYFNLETENNIDGMYTNSMAFFCIYEKIRSIFRAEHFISNLKDTK
jgi:hypothetical protein